MRIKRRIFVLSIMTLINFLLYTTIVLAVESPAQSLKKENLLKCYTYYATIESGEVIPGENFSFLANADNLLMVQDETELLPYKFLSAETMKLDYTIEGIDGDAELLSDKDYQTGRNVINNNGVQEVVIHLSKEIKYQKFPFIFVDTAYFHNRNFYYSLDGKNWSELDLAKLEEYDLQYIKVTFTPKPTKLPSDNEIISVGEILVKEAKNLFVAKSITSGKIDLYSGSTCPNYTRMNSGGDLIAQTNNPKFDIDLVHPAQASNIKITYPEKISNILMKNTQTIFPSIYQIISTILLCFVILGITLYIRNKANRKKLTGISPQKLFKKDTDELLKINKKDKNSVQFKEAKIKISGGKTKVFKSEKALVLVDLVINHYGENKQIFNPGELKKIYKDIVKTFKSEFSKKEYRKILNTIKDLVDKGGEIVINKDIKPKNKKKQGKK